MNKLFLVLIAVVMANLAFAQVAVVNEQVSKSFACVKKSWDAANKSLGEIQKSNLATSINELQSIAAKARNQMDEAMSQARNAEIETDGALGEVQNIECKKAEKVVAKAVKEFKKAKAKFEDAYAKLNTVLDEDRAGYLIDYLNSTISVIEQGRGNLKKGNDLLNDTLTELKSCK